MSERNPNPYIEMDREFQYDQLFCNPKYWKQLRLYLYLRMNTAHKEEVLRDVTLQKGQVIRSLRQMVEGLGLKYDGPEGNNVFQIRHSLEFLEEHGYISIQRRDHRPGIITVFADKSHSLEVPEFLENKGNSNTPKKEKSHSLNGEKKQKPAKQEKAPKNDEEAQKNLIVKSHSLKALETPENAEETDTGESEKSHSIFSPYENSKFYKEKGIKGTIPAADVDNFGAKNRELSTDTPEKHNAAAFSPTGIPSGSRAAGKASVQRSAPQGEGSTEVTQPRTDTITLTRENAAALVNGNPVKLLKLLEILEANNDQPTTVPKAVIEKIQKGL